MEIKLRANIVMSKELTIEANDWTEALEKAQAMMAEPIPYKELTPTRVFYDEISPMNWMSDENGWNYALLNDCRKGRQDAARDHRYAGAV